LPDVFYQIFSQIFISDLLSEFFDFAIVFFSDILCSRFFFGILYKIRMLFNSLNFIDIFSRFLIEFLRFFLFFVRYFLVVFGNFHFLVFFGIFNVSIFDQNFDFDQNFHFLRKIRLLTKKLNFFSILLSNLHRFSLFFSRYFFGALHNFYFFSVFFLEF